MTRQHVKLIALAVVLAVPLMAQGVGSVNPFENFFISIYNSVLRLALPLCTIMLIIAGAVWGIAKEHSGARTFATVLFCCVLVLASAKIIAWVQATT